MVAGRPWEHFGTEGAVVSAMVPLMFLPSSLCVSSLGEQLTQHAWSRHHLFLYLWSQYLQALVTFYKVLL